MMVAVMVNAQMGLPCIEKNDVFLSNYCRTPCLSSGLSISLRPVLRIKQRSRIRVVTGYPKLNASVARGLDNRMSGGEVLDKESGFKPSFGEYLKVMESVKTKRQKRKDNLEKKDEVLVKLDERDDDSVKIRTFEGQEQVLRVVKQDKLDKKSNGSVAKEGFFEEKLGKGEKEIKKIDMPDGVNVKGRETSYKQLNVARRQETHGKQSTYQDIVVREILRDSGMKNRVRWDHEGPIDSINSTRRSGQGLQGYRDPSNALEPEGSFRKKTDFSGQNWVLTGSETHKGYERDCTHDERFKHRKSIERKKFIRKNATSLENGHGESYEMERVAFKTVNVSDVVDMPRVPKMEMEERIQKLAKSLNGADIDMPEWMFSQMMRSAKIRFSDHSIVRVIQVLGQLGNWRRVLQVIEWLQMRERFKSLKLRFIYTTALNVLGKARRPVEALNVFHSMLHQMSSYPDMVAYRSIAVTLGQAGHMKELFDVIDCMRSPPKKKFKKGLLDKWDPRLEPDLVVYNAVLNACVKRKQWEGAFWVLQQFKTRDQQPSSTTYGLVMEVMLECGKYNLVHELFRKVQKSCIPNALTFRVLVNTLWREGKADEAVSAVNEMERRGIVGSAALYYDLARCLCSAGRCQEALMQIKKMSRVANKPLVVTYTGLIQACLDSGNTQDAAHIFGQMRGFCHPNLVTYNILLKAYSEHRMFEEAKELFSKMLEDGRNIRSTADYKDRVVPDTYTFNTLLDACVAEKSWDDFEYFYKLMLRHGYHFNAKRHLRMILDASKAGKVEVVETTWKHLEQGDRMAPLPLVLERFRIKVESNEFSSAVSCIAAVRDGESQAISRVVWLKMFKDNAHRFKQESLDGLVDEVTGIIGRSDSQNLALQDLLVSCNEFMKTHKVSYCHGSTTSKFD